MSRVRNQKIDLLRGFAAIVVVLGHVLQRYNGHIDNMMFNVIFSFQMPLFMMISGYTCIYSKEIDTKEELINHITKRIRSLLLPWFAWSTLAYVFLGKLPLLEYIADTIMHMESAFWFLFSLWTIDLLFAIARFIHNKTCKSECVIFQQMMIFVIFGITLVPLLVVGLKVGITFLAIKYTLYYSLYYLCGYVIAIFYQSKEYKKSAKTREFIFLVVIMIYALLISRFSVISMPDNLVYILIRIMISILACWLLFEIINSWEIKDGLIVDVIKQFGSLSLELYVVHYFIVKWLDVGDYDVNSINGFLVSLGHFVIVLVISYVIIRIINSSSFARKILFGKK